MSTDAITLIDGVRFYIEEPILENKTDGAAGGRYTQNQILASLNHGKNRLWDIFRTVKKDYFMTVGDTSLTLNATTKIYSFPATFRQLTALKVTTSGYESVRFRAIDMADQAFKLRDALPASSYSDNGGASEILYCIVSTGKLRLADFPPTTLATSMDYIAWLADYTLSSNSTTEIPDEWEEFMKKYAAMDLTMTTPESPIYKTIAAQVQAMIPAIQGSISYRQIRDPKFVEPYEIY